MNKTVMEQIGRIQSLSTSDNAIVRRIARGSCSVLDTCVKIGYPRGDYVEKFFSYGGQRWGECVVTLSFDCDFEEDVHSLPAVVDLLKEHGIRASFACVGRLIEDFPDEHKIILQGGHEILNHTHTHPHNPVLNPNTKFNRLSYDAKEAEIQKCDEVCRDILKYEPTGFRTPHFGGLHTDSVYRILGELGYEYSSSTIATKTRFFGSPYFRNNIIEFPLSPDPSNPFKTLTTYGIQRAPRKRYSEQRYFSLLGRLLDTAVRTRAYLNLYFDPMDVVKMRARFENFLSSISETEEVQNLAYRDIAGKMGFSRGGRQSSPRSPS
jgi:peptidoglycan/xylan/chitin deacetylase (PgdA/CDA1 family)